MVGKIPTSGSKNLSFSDRTQMANVATTATITHSDHIIEPVNFFRGVDPPADVLEAYDRLNQGCSSKSDEGLIRNFREQQSFDLNVLKTKETPLVKVPCVIFDPKVYDVLVQDKRYRDENAKEQRKQPAAKGSQKQLRRVRKGLNLGEQKHMEKADVPQQDRPSSQIERSPPPQQAQKPHLRRRQPAEETSTSHTRLNRIGFGGVKGIQKLRRVSSLENLRQVQISIQSDIIHKIAVQARDEASQSCPSSPLSSMNTRIRRPSIKTTKSSKTKEASSSASDDDLHRSLEIHAAAAHKLRMILVDDETLEDVTINDLKGVRLSGEEKRSEVESLLLVSERKFEEVVDEVTTPYVPTGRCVTEDELREAFDDYIAICDLLKRYDHMEVKDVVIAFKKLGGRAALSDIR